MSILAALLLLALPGFSPVADTTAADTTALAEGTLSEVVVTAARLETTLASAPSRVTVLHGDRLRNGRASSLADVLEGGSGAFIQRHGPSGLATMSLRGSSSSQTVILLDGRRITPPQLDVFDLTLLPTVLVESVEVMHGAASPLYGSDGIGGAVNVRTLPPGTAASWRASATVGAFGEREASALFSLEEGRLATVAAVEMATAENDFPYVNRALLPAETMRRRNADVERVSMYTSSRYEDEQTSLRVSGWYDEAERGLPGLATAPSADERQWDRRLRLWADAEHRLGRTNLKLRGLFQHTTLRYEHTGQGIDDTGRALVAGLEAEAVRPVAADWVAAGGMEASTGRALHPNLSGNARQHQAGAFAYGMGRLGPVLAYPAVRVDAAATPQGRRLLALSPRMGVNMALWEATSLYGKASIGRTFRSPTLNDRYWQPGGNPDLRPERGWSADAGLFLQGERSRAELSGFLHHVHDQIVWRPTGDGHWSPFNLRQVRSAGVEASGHTRRALSSWLDLEADIFYTFTSARDRSDPASSSYNRQLRYVPREVLKGQLTLVSGPLAFDLGGRYVGRRYITTDERRYLDPFIVLTAQASLTHSFSGVRAQLGLLLENALDADYAVVANQPMPPRHVRVLFTIEPIP